MSDNQNISQNQTTSLTPHNSEENLEVENSLPIVEQAQENIEPVIPTNITEQIQESLVEPNTEPINNLSTSGLLEVAPVEVSIPVEVPIEAQVEQKNLEKVEQAPSLPPKALGVTGEGFSTPSDSLSPKNEVILPAILELLNKARNAIQFRKRKKLEKLMQMFNTKLKVTNDEVEKFLYVSDATATRYLTTLEKEGKVKQVGKVGKGVWYERLNS
jgi:Mn-dependent DtxR family transcriptional regulator